MFVSVEVFIEDIVNDLDSIEKRELCQKLIDEGHGPDGDATTLEELFKPEIHTERELVNLFRQLWENRIHIDTKKIDEITADLKVANIL